MSFGSGTAEVGETPAAICAVPEGGVKIRNLGAARLFTGGPGVTAEGPGAGYPVDAGASDTIHGPKLRESPVVPAPEGDMTAPVLYGVSESGIIRVAWITA